MGDLHKDIPFIWTEKGLFKTERIMEINRIGGLNNNKIYNAPLSITLELTSLCNFRCLHCYNNSGDYKHKKEELSENDWKKLIKEIKMMQIFECVLSGGEPFMAPSRLFYALDELRDTAISVSINTNGTFLDEKNIVKLKEYELTHIQISLDGAKKMTHEEIRNTECWETIIDNIVLLNKEGIPVQIAFTINKINQSEIASMVKTAYMLGCVKIVFGFYENSGRANENEDVLLLTSAEKRRIYNELKHLYYDYKELLPIQILSEKRLLIDLMSGRANNNLVVSANGDIKYNCFIDEIIGNIKEETLQTIWNQSGKYVWRNRSDR